MSSLEREIGESGIRCELRLASGESHRFGDGPPEVIVTLHNDGLLNARMTEFALGKAYVDGEFEIEGDMLRAMDFRDHLKSRSELSVVLKFLVNLFLRSTAWVNRNSIAGHYEFGDDFYLTFIDKRFRFYSHCVFHSDDDTLEQAAEQKLESMFEGLKLEPGMRLLDIGAGWGGVHEYCGPRGVHVTSVTLTEDSQAYTQRLIDEMGLENCAVFVEDFLEHEPEEPYDAVVIYGVIEHIPYYRKFCRRLWKCLKPGGLFYLDASATLEKYEMGDFTRTYIWPGTHTFLCMQEMLQELLYHGFDIVRVREETRDYELTMKHWASRFDGNREAIVDGWGEKLYRAFRTYLWAGCHAFRVNRLQAYHLVARRRPDAGPRPGIWKRTLNHVRGLM
ncbi:MAG: class I SAM-dependent methyltransferase [Proteobacteria bacterium]|nr:class I SAM-dependent methyltransferase [Pseudomonadota bacterium]